MDLIHPPQCLLCAAPRCDSGDGLCPPCRQQLPLVASPCTHCSEPAAPPQNRPRCPVCREGPLPLPLRWAGEHRGGLRRLILAAKWQGDAATVAPLARWTADRIRAGGWGERLDGWCPVPRDRWRLLCHGVPLSEHLGRELGEILGLGRLPPPRRRHRPAQARLAAPHRRRNLRGAFRYSERARRRLIGRRILLVDDVLTTGATLLECAAVIRAGGAEEVRGAVVAVSMRAVP